MTRTKTLRESSKYLSDRYKFKRKLGTRPSVSNAFNNRDTQVNRVSSVKDVSIVEQLCPLPPSALSPLDDDQVTAPIMHPAIHIRKHNTEWPFRIEYIEQLLDVDEIWIVVYDGRRRTRGGYSHTATGVASTFSDSISIEMVKISRPRVILGHVRSALPRQRQLLGTEKQLRAIEDSFENDANGLVNFQPVWIEGNRPTEWVDAFICNILPHSPTQYNTTFYNRDVAHLYLESLSEHVKAWINQK